MSNTTLHIPMDKTVRDVLETKAKRLGFDSAQAYIRVWAKAEAEDRSIDYGIDDWGRPSPTAAKRLNKTTSEALRGKNISKPFLTAQDALDHLESL
ncbi:hypothetical protein IPL85_00070 [Candidatus Saccharibacteria bacterium]|nr:MAG: hypothetical protein IPL85_00070 [Candidatus Saccharibacteria bacterium]